MSSTKEIIKEEITSLITYGEELLNTEIKNIQNVKSKKKPLDVTVKSYQTWYTKSLSIINEFAPERLDEFKNYYEIPKRTSITLQTYVINDFLLGFISSKKFDGGKYFDDFRLAITKISMQIMILSSIKEKIDSIFGNLKDIIEAEFFDDELEAAQELLKNKYFRASGALAGVTLERHLRNICIKHNIKLTKKNNSISDYNDALKNKIIFDVIKWRFIQHLGDLRNLCDHSKTENPKKEDIEELLSGVDKVIKTYF